MATWSQNTFVTNNVTLHYWQSSHLSYKSDAALPFLIFLHGFFLTGANMIGPFSELANHFTVILPDARGHGYSQPIPQGSLTLENVVKDAVAVIQRVSPDAPVLLGGHSMGAATAAHVANKFPDLVVALLLEEPPWNRPPGVPYKESWYLNKTTQFLNANDAVHRVRELKSKSAEELVKTGEAQELPYPMQDDIFAVRTFDILDVTSDEVQLADVDITEAVFGISVPVMLQIGDTVTLPYYNTTRLNPVVANMAIQSYATASLESFKNGNHFLHEWPTSKNWKERTSVFFLLSNRMATRISVT